MEKTNEYKKKSINKQSRLLLKFILKSSVEISQRRDSKLIYTDSHGKNINSEIKPIEYQNNDLIAEDVDKLVFAEYLLKKPIEITIACPKCLSTNLQAHFICQNCLSSDFVKGEVIEHNKCGHADLQDAFEDKSLDKFVCPKCKKELKLIGVDYFRLESAFKCKKCSVIFSNPTPIYNCKDCSTINQKYSELSWKQLFSYKISPAKIAEIKHQIISLDEVEKYLTNLGFKVNVDYKMQSRNEIIGPFDIIAKKNEITLVVTSLEDDIEDNFTKIFELNNLDKILTGTVHKLVLLYYESKEVTKNIMGRFNVNYIVVEDAINLFEKFKIAYSRFFPDQI